MNDKIDYKGLNINHFKGGTHIYPNDENACYVFHNGDVVDHIDVSVISEEEYIQAKRKFENSIPISDTKRIEELEKTQGDLLMEIALLKMGGSF
ncbi:hypothetical protein ACFSO7_20645 [Bacillus sp. CGMCC 1.16607]|uniref:hypothetical protein n=1 Tax=Bacillus sp. CGMCC 1.16607 TaxID=3351842 RepID=UPI0036288FED